jgi:hypothetical protein
MRLKALQQNFDLVAVMITVIIAGVVAYVGINIMSNTQESTNISSGDPFYTSQEDLTQGLQQFFSQLETVFVVIVLVVVISYLMMLRGR